MILLISPAKTLDFDAIDQAEYTTPVFMKETKKLVKVLKTKSATDIKALMKVSDKIADLNVVRYKSFKTPFTTKNAKQAMYAFRGDVYTGLDADSFNKSQVKFAQKHLRILSGLYGVLKPLDLMQPYRLEMGTKLANANGKNLYEFWDDKITNSLNEEISAQKDNYVINLASNEYFKSVRSKNLNGQVIDIQFKENKDGKYKIVAFFAKKARGMMCQYMIKNKLTKPEQLKGFNMENYLFNEELSEEGTFVFTR